MYALTQTSALSRRLQWRVAGLFFACVLVSRLPAFFLSVLDWDESLYGIMAGQWRLGHLPYTTIWDNKPIGIYGIFLLFQAVFGNPVLAMRAATIAAVTASAFAVFRIAYALVPGGNPGRLAYAMFAGIAFIICSISNDGLAANTEIFMACFTAFAVLCALSPQFCVSRPGLRGLAVGLLFGLAFMTKYVAVFESPAIGFALLWFMPGLARARFAACAAAIAGAALPLLATVLVYALTGNLKIWWNCSIAANFLRVATPISGGAVTYVLGLQLTRWLPLFCAAAILPALLAWQMPRMLRGKAADGAPLCLLLLWLVGGTVGVASAKLFYDHYFLQILPVLCVIPAWLLGRYSGRLNRAVLETGVAVFLVIPCYGAGVTLMSASLPLVTSQQGASVPHADTPARIAAAIAALPAGTPRQIYVFDYQPVIYSLVGQTPPTRYAFPSILTKCFLSHVAGVDAVAETHRILAGNPAFIIRSLLAPAAPALRNQVVYDEVKQDIAARYDLWRGYSDAAVYRLRHDAAPLGALPIGYGHGCG